MDVVLLMVFISVLLSLFFIVLFFCFSKKGSHLNDPQRNALLPLEGDEETEGLASGPKEPRNDSE